MLGFMQQKTCQSSLEQATGWQPSYYCGRTMIRWYRLVHRAGELSGGRAKLRHKVPGQARIRQLVLMPHWVGTMIEAAA
ncbi:hypothetical protein B0E50_12880 [Rhodanobacter sp. C01]|nr:hypothetical protein B0E50_12880 [Rhodanobacter sp. C01]